MQLHAALAGGVSRWLWRGIAPAAGRGRAGCGLGGWGAGRLCRRACNGWWAGRSVCCGDALIQAVVHFAEGIALETAHMEGSGW